MKEILNMKYEVTEKRAAQMLGVSTARVSQLVGEALLDAVTINGRVRISAESIAVYQRESKRPGRPANHGGAEQSWQGRVIPAGEAVRIETPAGF